MPKPPCTPARADMPLLTVPDAADFINMSEKTIRRRIDDGQLPVHRIGNRIRIDQDELRRFLVRCRTLGKPVQPSP